MKTVIRLFDYDPEVGSYNDFCYTQWEGDSLPVPRVGEFIYTRCNSCEEARVDSVTYSFPENDGDYIMIDLNVTLYNGVKYDD